MGVRSGLAARGPAAALMLLALSACAPEAAQQRPSVAGPVSPRDDNGAIAMVPPGDAVADPQRLKGLQAQQLNASLGSPSFRRKDPPAEVWQYAGKGCVLDVFLYDEKGLKRVAFAELRSLTPGQLPQPQCMTIPFRTADRTS